VADPKFITQKKIEKRLHEKYPDQWMPLYSMVTFSDLRYSEALAQGLKQQKIMDELLTQTGIEESWENLDLDQIIARLNEAASDSH